MRQLAPLLHQLVHILVHIFKDKVKLVVFLDYFVESDDIGMVQFGKNPHFVEVDALVPIFILVFHLFDCHQLPRLLIESLHHRPETTVSQLVPQLVFLHSNLFII